MPKQKQKQTAQAVVIDQPEQMQYVPTYGSKICPIRATANFPQLSPCLTTDCAWWDVKKDRCAVLSWANKD